MAAKKCRSFLQITMNTYFKLLSNCQIQFKTSSQRDKKVFKNNLYGSQNG